MRPGDDPEPNGNAIHQLYTDSSLHNIGIPFNREVPGVAMVGLSRHVVDPNRGLRGMNKTPYLRNVDKRPNAPT